MDAQCSFEHGTVKIGGGESWLEIGGCGIVNRRVLEACHLDPERVQGFAFGFGIDRLAMLKYGMPDLRPYFEADPQWTRHYGFSPWSTPSVSGGLS